MGAADRFHSHPRRLLDEIIPIGQAQALYHAWCARGAEMVFTVVPGRSSLSVVRKTRAAG